MVISLVLGIWKDQVNFILINIFILLFTFVFFFVEMQEDSGITSDDPDHCKDARGSMLLLRGTKDIAGDEKVF